MLSVQDNCLFVHIPKVAGQSIESVFLARAGLTWQQRETMLLKANDNPALGPPRLAHLTAREYVERGHVEQEYFDRLFKFSFVRNPWDRLVSEYLYRKHRFAFKDWLFHYFPKPRDDDYFAAYDLYRHVMPQYDFLHDQQGKLLVDYVGKFERLAEDFANVSQLITGYALELPHQNRTQSLGLKSRLRKLVMPYLESKSRQGYEAYYDNESKMFVEDLYAKDIKHFGYRFGLT